MKSICKLLTFFITKQTNRSPIFWLTNWNTLQVQPLGLSCYTSTILSSSYIPGKHKNLLTYNAYNKQYSILTLLLFSILGSAFLLLVSYILLVLSVGDQSTVSDLLTLIFALVTVFICGLGYSNRPKTVIWLYIWGYLISPDVANPAGSFWREHPDGTLNRDDPKYIDALEEEKLAAEYEVSMDSMYVEDSSLEFYYYTLMNDPKYENSTIRL